MIPVTTRKGQKIALFGLGGSGMVTAGALLAGGAELTAFDDNPEKVGEAAAKSIPVGDLRGFDFANADALVLSPGVPLTHPKPHWTVELASQHNVPVVGDVGLFADERRKHAPDSPFVAITGTNGKSTTTALVSHMLQHAGRDVQMGGNIGRAVLSLEPPARDRMHVVECSSYQIDLAPDLDAQIGVLLNLAPDHLDRHNTMENYSAIKTRLIEKSSSSVLGVDDKYTLAVADKLEAEGMRITRISSAVVQNGYGSDGGNILFFQNGKGEPLASLAGIQTLRGKHNLQNAAAAVAVCRLAGLTNSEVQSGLETFPGLAHRMEVLGSAGNVMFVNDSKATNADAAAMALGSFDNIYWIAGGLAKDGGIEDLKSGFGNVRKAYLVGEAAPQFAATLGNEVPFEISGTIDVAVKHALKDAGDEGHSNPVVLLSPACASFDQYPNFEVRGDTFRQTVQNLADFCPYSEMSR